jgi:hypothetical protein
LAEFHRLAVSDSIAAHFVADEDRLAPSQEFSLAAQQALCAKTDPATTEGRMLPVLDLHPVPRSAGTIWAIAAR